MRGIVLAGGFGTRLSPLTRVTSKQLLPVYDKPMIFYPVSTLILAGIREILIVSDPQNLPFLKGLLGKGEDWGLEISYSAQSYPDGIAGVFSIADRFIRGHGRVALILGDNLFHGAGLGSSLAAQSELSGATIFGAMVKNPEDFGVIEFSNTGQVIGIQEKPQFPKSNYAVPGLYFYDEEVLEIAQELRPSNRGELEITDVNQIYLARGKANVTILPRGTAWIDTGTFDALAEASQYVKTVEKIQGVKLGCPEEAAWRMGYIDDKQLAKLAEPLMKSGYGQYLIGLLEQGK